MSEWNQDTDAMLSVEGLQVNYGDFIAVKDASLSVPYCEIVSVVGTNGAGKSTLFDCVAGVVKPRAGRVFFKGEDITALPAHEVVAKGLTLVPQGSRCFIRMTVEENLIMGSYTKKARKDRAATLKKTYELFPVLFEKRNDLSGSLSGGQRQMVAIGRALMNRPEMILFDEISLGLAPTVIKDIYARIKEINRDGVTAVLIEQDVKRSLRTSSRCNVMLKGKVVLTGSSRELTEEKIKAAYFGV
ncbi:MAG: ABC transporter ATP-binding protein [Clostridiales Family XIII bacterium]|jgi:branched-chain amino acid transport system ATP-binding protein|nr:ABC transporter ATP-binding protein [Clostridiales Family XIII bacterium]